MLTGGRPAGSAWDPIGNDVGDDVWYLPQGNIAGTPFLGLATEELDPNDWDGGMTWEVISVTGPGQFSLWQNGAPNPNFFVSSVDGLPDSFTRGIGGHDHYNYGFTALGTYDVTFQVSATHVSDGFQSDTATFRFTAVPEPGSFAALASLSAIGMLVRRRRKL
jgi:surface-anchored protein